ncbi:methionyl-tRNA formyltransferase [Candidatus Fermentibacteria bacterium]|nr:methionyl-tRNA formyltransferase [Candidatus Fermentibacteria bacterium]
MSEAGRGTGLIFLGSGSFAVPLLNALASDCRWSVECVVTRPDARAGRGLARRESPVASAASGLGIEVFKTAGLGAEARLRLGGIHARAAVAADFGLRIPRWVLDLPEKGVVNVHPSLLPRYRGPSPVAWTILNGDRETGVTFMLTDEGWDTGPILAAIPHEVRLDDTSGSLAQRLSSIASLNISSILEDYISGRIKPCPQPVEGTRAPIVPPCDRWLRWNMSAEVLERRVRALQPEPGALALFRGRRIEICRASSTSSEGPPGRISVSRGAVSVFCGRGALELLEVRPESRRTMSGRSFAAGYGHLDGEVMDAPP